MICDMRLLEEGSFLPRHLETDRCLLDRRVGGSDCGCLALAVGDSSRAFRLDDATWAGPLKSLGQHPGPVLFPFSPQPQLIFFNCSNVKITLLSLIQTLALLFYDFLRLRSIAKAVASHEA